MYIARLALVLLTIHYFILMCFLFYAYVLRKSVINIGITIPCIINLLGYILYEHQYYDSASIILSISLLCALFFISERNALILQLQS